MLRVALGVLMLWLLALGQAAGAALERPMPRQFSVLDGLPSNGVHGIAEDRQGYLWIATRDGLARYDGVGFRVWRMEDGLRDNFVWWVHVDARDRVWIGTQSAGLAMLDEQRREFRHYDMRSHPQMRSNNIWAVDSTPDGAIWFSTDRGVYRLDAGGALRRFAHDPKDPRGLPSDEVVAISIDPNGTPWLASKRGVARWNGRGFERALPELGDAMINLLTFDREGNLWIDTADEDFVRRPDGRLEAMPWIDPVLGEPALHVMLQDRSGTRWLDTRSGLAREHGGRVEDVPLYSNTSRGLVRPAWSITYQDREGGLWFGSSNSGLWHLPANWRNFSMLSRRLDDDSTMRNAVVHGIAPARDNGLWLVGSGGELDWLDPRTGNIRHFQSRTCGDRITYGVIEAPDGMVWVGCHGMLARFDPRTGAIRRWSAVDAADAALHERIRYFVVQRDGTIWSATDGQVQMRDPDGKVLDSVEPGDGRGLAPGTAIQQMMRAPDGGVWLASIASGVLMWNDGRRVFEPVPGSPARGVLDMTFTADNIVWLAGTGTLTAYRWDGERLIHIETVDADDGLPRVAASGLVLDRAGMLWVPSLRGLIRYDPQRKRVRIFGLRDGLPSQEFSGSPIQGTPLGYLAVGTSDGLVLFHPQRMRSESRTPTLAMESIDVRRGEARHDLPRSGAFTLRHDDRDLRVSARLLSFTDAHAHRYRFRLDGYDPDWVEPETGGERTFPRLTSGRYHLEIQARTADGDWTAPLRLDFRVTPPWWRAPWALALWALAAASLLWWSAFAYRKRLKRRHAWQLAVQKRELAEQASLAKTRFLATLGHEVRTPMTGVLGMSELLLSTPLDGRQRGYAESIRRAGEHLMRLVNDALDLARIEAGKLELDPQPFDLHALLDEVIGLTAPMARQRGLSFRTGLGSDVPRWLSGDPVRVRQILLNLLGNAIKFTEHGEVGLRVERGDGGVRLLVSDTGPGLNAAQKERLFRRFEQAEGARTAARYGGSGLGLAICQELAAAMGGRIDVDSLPGRGTRFIVELPLQAAESGGEAAAPKPPAAPAPRAPLQLLLVEDDPTVADVIVGLLRAQGHRVVHAAHGLAALTEIASTRFDLALLDLDLPGLDGLALARQLRARGFAQPLLAVTARADAEAEPQAREAGFNGFLRKPLTGDMLHEAIEAQVPATRG